MPFLKGVLSVCASMFLALVAGVILLGMVRSGLINTGIWGLLF